MALEAFLAKFGGQPEGTVLESVPELDWQANQQPGALDSFLKKYKGETEAYFFYNKTVELRFDPEEHIYYKVGDLGQLEPQDGVTNTVHIINKSEALVPWSAKMTAEKVLRTVPVAVRLTLDAEGQMVEEKYIPEISYAEFEKIVLEAKSAHKDKLTDASDVGHVAHTWLEHFIRAILAMDAPEQDRLLRICPAIKEDQVITDERAKNCCMAALGWMHSHNVRWISTERKIYSLTYGFAGTMDGLALVDSCTDPKCKGCHGTVFKDILSVIDWKSSNYLYLEYLYQTASYEFAYEEEFETDIKDRWILRLGKDDGEFEPWHTTPEDFQEDFEGFLDCLSLTRSVRLTSDRLKDQRRVIREVAKDARHAAKEAEKVAKRIAKEKAKMERRAIKAAEKEAARQAKKAAKLIPKEVPNAQETLHSAG